MRLSLAVAMLIALSAVARADVVLQYSFTTSLDPTAVGANAMATAVTAAPKVNNQTTATLTLATGVGYPTQPFVAAARGTANESGNRADVYFNFTLTANAGYQLNLSNMSFDVARGGSSGTRDYDVRSSVDNYASSLTGPTPVTISALRPTFELAPVDLSAPAFQGLSSITLQVRFFTTGVAQNVDFDNIVVNGTVTPMPEPAAGALLLAGSGLLLRRRRSHERPGLSSAAVSRSHRAFFT